MTPHRTSNGRGTFMLDRRFAGVGRIHRASGTNDARTLRAINAMLTRLFELGRIDTLRAMRSGDLHPLTAYNLYRKGDLKELPDLQTVRALEADWEAWQRATPSKHTRRARAYAWGKLAEVLPGSPTLADLPEALRTLRLDLQEHPPAFNRVRAAALAFVRDTVGRSHQLYASCTDVLALRERRQKRTAPPIAKAIRIREALPEPAAAMWWSMYLTGMGPDEYDSGWEVVGAQVQIPGTKRDARRRMIPLFGPLTRRGMGWKQYREALAALPAELAVQRYDARRGFLHLLEEARITRIRRKMYAGHALGDVTGGYERAELEAFVEADRQAVQAKLVVVEQQLAAERRAGLKRA